MVFALIGCLIIIGFLGFKLYQKQKIDKSELEQYHLDIDTARTDLHELVMQQRTEIQRVAQYKADYRQYKQRAEEYQDLINNKFADIDNQIEEQRQKRQEELDKSLNETKEKYEFIKEKAIKECMDELDSYWRERDQQKILADNEITSYKTAVDELKTQYESLLEPIKQYEKEKQERLFYTIQLPEEYQEDIEFLLTTVAAKVQHPDIISKLVWTEYVKPNIEDTFRRVEIKSEPGIYKLTSLETGKAYIGKSTDVKKRIADHFKSSVGIRSIADQAVHHAILKEGFWNWTIEVITYVDKDKLNELEKYYIEFFKTQEFGYNKNSGGGG